MDYDSGSSTGTVLWRVVRAVVPWIGLLLVIVAIWNIFGAYREASSDAESTTSTVEATSTEGSGSRYVRVISEGLNLRAEPSTSANVLMRLPADQHLQFIEEKTGWYHVRTEDGAAEGWVAAGSQYSVLVEP